MSCRGHKASNYLGGVEEMSEFDIIFILISAIFGFIFGFGVCLLLSGGRSKK
jgi:hypothetical protein